MKELQAIQQALAVPKGQYNKFNHFYYRSLEDIMNALKPLLKEYNCSLNISDELVNIGERYYIKATVVISNSAGKEEIGIGYAREADNQKGMDSAQLTGSTSTYARKYACNGLFLIDDTLDPDSNEIQKLKEKNGNSKSSTDKKDPSENNDDGYTKVVEDEMSGRDISGEADNCKDEKELAVWWGNLPAEMRLPSSPVVAVKDARKKAIKFELANAGQTALEQVKASKEVKEKQMDYSFESLKNKTVAVLKQIAKEFEITGFSKMDKPSLITAIIKIRGDE